MRCKSRCKGVIPETNPELLKALDTVLDYFRDYCIELGCNHPYAQCLIDYINNILLNREYN